MVCLSAPPPSKAAEFTHLRPPVKRDFFESSLDSGSREPLATTDHHFRRPLCSPRSGRFGPPRGSGVMPDTCGCGKRKSFVFVSVVVPRGRSSSRQARRFPRSRVAERQAVTLVWPFSAGLSAVRERVQGARAFLRALRSLAPGPGGGAEAPGRTPGSGGSSTSATGCCR